MDPGELNKVITVLAPSGSGRDAAGAPVSNLVEVARPWAKVIEQTGREFIAADGEQSVKKVVFRIWRDATVSTTSVVRYRDIDHDVQDVRSFDDVTEMHTVARAS